MYHSSRDVNQRASGCPYGVMYRLAVIEIERKLSFKDVERLVVLRMGMKWCAFPFRSNLLDKRETIAGMLGAGFGGPEGPEASERLFFGA